MHLGGKSSGLSSLFSVVPFLSLYLIFVPFMSCFHPPLYLCGALGGTVVEALCYKPEGHGIDS
jgi:ABC-type multidrug transport system permease subunit